MMYSIYYAGEDVAKIEGKTEVGNEFEATFNIEKIIGDPMDPKKIVGEGFLEMNGERHIVTEYNKDKGFKYGDYYIQ